MLADLEPAELHAWRGLLTTHGRLIRVLNAELTKATGLTLSHYEILLFLHAAPSRSMRMSQLADRCLLSRSGMTRSIDHFVRLGLVERRRCPSDARGLLATLTDAGAKRLRQAAPIHLEGVRRHFTSKLDPAQLDTLGELLWVAAAEMDGAEECDQAV